MAIYLSGRNSGLALADSTDKSFRGFLDSVGELKNTFSPSDDIYVAMDLDSATIREMALLGVNRDRAVLLRFEPRVVCPKNFSRRASLSFSRIVDIGRFPSGDATWEYWPQNWPVAMLEPGLMEDRNSDRAVLINANKLSLICGEMYSLRRKLLHHLPVDTFGHNWSATISSRLRTLAGEFLIAVINMQRPRFTAMRLWFARHPGLQGPSGDKIETLSGYRMALIVENSPEYMSEKLFDALIAGCIPIYVGPSVQLFHIPAELVVESGASLKAVKSALEKAKSLDYSAWRISVKSFLEAPETRERWASEEVFARLLKRIAS